jgi:hypothetical protein
MDGIWGWVVEKKRRRCRDRRGKAQHVESGEDTESGFRIFEILTASGGCTGTLGRSGRTKSCCPLWGTQRRCLKGAGEGPA